MAQAAAADPIPAAAFPSIQLEAALEDRYATGQALALKGRAADPGVAGGQILFRFTPQTGGDALLSFINLDGQEFAGYRIFSSNNPEVEPANEP